jgi:phosphate transport system protein
MRANYRDQLDTISAELVEMTRLVGSAMALATQSLLDADLNLAEQVIKDDQAVDDLNLALEEKCFQVTALQQPVATDLRITMSGLRISASLERMGDLAAHVAKQARLRYPNQAVPLELRATFARLGSLCQEIVAKTGAVIETKDVSLATDIRRDDDEIDRMHRELFTVVLSPSWSHGVEAAIDVTLLSRYYERYADHAVTISRRVVHIVTGEPYGSIVEDQL